jgi:hypothetical protein
MRLLQEPVQAALQANIQTGQLLAPHAELDVKPVLELRLAQIVCLTMNIIHL